MDLDDMLRLQQVKRWPICSTNTHQSVAEHSFNVTIIARHLAMAASGMSIWEVVEYALMHDMDEVFTGDIPSSFKRKLRAQFPPVAAMLDPACRTKPDVKAVVKLADMIEAMHHLHEFGGSRLAMDIKEDIFQNYAKALDDPNLPPLAKSAAMKLAGLWS
jgi:5'-deoxynucleotidase YfbR-like HD superfamily hydrolase